MFNKRYMSEGEKKPEALLQQHMAEVDKKTKAGTLFEEAYPSKNKGTEDETETRTPDITDEDIANLFEDLP